MRRAMVLLLILAVACSSQSGKPAASGSGTAAAATGKLSSGGIVEYAVPDPPLKPADCFRPCQPSIGSMALGADGNVWFTDVNRRAIGKVTPDGKVTQFTAPMQLAGGAQTIAAGPDGNMYVTATGGGGGKRDWILRVTSAGQITQLTAGVQQPGQEGFGSGPESITRGPDGNMWFTEFWTNRVGRLSPSGELTEFSIPSPESAPRGITVGPDGNLWFTESSRARPAIARITPAGTYTEFPVAYGQSDLYPRDIIAGPAGSLWFSETTGIGRITTKGAIIQIALPEGSQPGKLVLAPDGNLWYSDVGRASIVRLYSSGTTRTFPLPRPGTSPWGMAVGADGRIWFGESEFGLIGSIGLRVPDLQLDRRPLVFADASSKTVGLRNVGEAPLTISSVRVAGLDVAQFVKGSDRCSSTTLAPDAGCEVEVRRLAGGPAGLQSAVLEVSDNGTGSPQRLSLLAQVPQCTLPVIAGGRGQTPAQGMQLDVRQARIFGDANGGFESGQVATGVRTQRPPTLVGPASGYYDRVVGRWLPVSSAAQVSPDGYRYAFAGFEQIPGNTLHVVDAVSGAEKVWPIRPDFWSVLAYTKQGIYLHVVYEGIGAGLWLVDPDTGAFKTVFADGQVTALDGSYAWLQKRNPADTLPDLSGMGGATNEILRRNIDTGQTTSWLYRPGTNMSVVGIAGGKPIVSIYDGDLTTTWIMSAPTQLQRMDFPFSVDRYPSVGAFVSDSNGVWVGSDHGVYLWTPRTNSVLMINEAAAPAGTCA